MPHVDQELQIADRELDEFAEIPSVRDMDGAAAADHLDKFTRTAINWAEEMRRSCESSQAGCDFAERFARDKRRAIAQLDLRYKQTDNETDPKILCTDLGDGHCSYGVTNGLAAQSIRNAGAHIVRKLLDEPRQPFVIKGRGRRQENRKAEEIVSAILEQLLLDGGWKRRARVLLSNMPRQQISVLRYEMGGELKFEPHPETGEMVETAVETVPQFRVWPTNKVLVSDQSTPFAEEQEIVYWITENATILDLQKDERIVQDGELVSGKFSNLEAVRKEIGAIKQNPPPSQTGGEKVTAFPRYTLIEIEGALPMQHWAEQGIITPEITERFGIDAGELPPEGNEDALKEWARRLGRIPYWRMAYLSDTPEYAGSSHVARHLLRLEPDPNSTPGNGLFVFRFFRDGENWYGRSLPDLGECLEKAADLMLNAKVRASDINSNPPRMVRKQAFVTNNVQKIREFLTTPGAVQEIVGDEASLKDNIVMDMTVEDPADLVPFMGVLRDSYHNLVGVQSGVPSATETGTFSEIQMDEQKSSQEMDQVVLEAASELCRLFKCVIDDFFHYMPEEFLVPYIERVTGMDASGIQEVLPSIDGLTKELRIEHPMTANQDPVVILTVILKVAAQFPEMFVKIPPEQLLRFFMDLIGCRQAADLIGVDAMDPEDEHGQMRQGNAVDPEPMEDFMIHLAAHLPMLDKLKAAAAMADSQGMQLEPEIENLMALLPQHVEETMNLLSVAVAQQQQAAGPAEGGGKGPATKPAKVAPGSSPGEGTQPPGAPEIAAQITSQAHGAPTP